MTMKGITLSVLFFLGLIAACQGQTPGYNWTAVRTNVGQICPAVDFWSASSGYVLDFISGPGPLLLRTDDGGKTLTPALNSIEVLVFVDIVSSNNGQNAVTGGVSLLGESISIQTTDGGQTWNKSSTTVLSSAFAALQVLTDDSIVFFGTWSTRTAGSKSPVDYNGYVISTNGGNSYSFISWPFAVAPVGGSFVGTNFVAVSGSAAPAVPDDDADNARFDYRRLQKAHQARAGDFPANETYRSYVAISTDAGSSWTTSFSFEGTDNITGISLGDIQFVSTTTGLVIGSNHTDTGSTAFVLGTTNGGATWTTLLEVPDGFFLRLECVSATDCYVLGGVPGGLLGQAVVWYTNNAGKTFTATAVPKLVAFVDISVISPTQMYASAVTAFQTCDLYYYGPPQ